MPRYVCRYQSDGMEQSCFIEANSASEAAARMHRIRWASGSGPIGKPKRERISPAVAAVCAVMVALGMAASVSAIGPAEGPRLAAVTTSPSD